MDDNSKLIEIVDTLTKMVRDYKAMNERLEIMLDAERDQRREERAPVPRYFPKIQVIKAAMEFAQKCNYGEVKTPPGLKETKDWVEQVLMPLLGE